METIRTPTAVPKFSLRAVLDGVSYTITMSWNMRSGWYLAMDCADGTVLFPPKRLLADWNVLTGSTDARRPRGALFLLDNSGQHMQAGMNDLGVTHFLSYVPASEINA